MQPFYLNVNIRPNEITSRPQNCTNHEKTSLTTKHNLQKGEGELRTSHPESRLSNASIHKYISLIMNLHNSHILQLYIQASSSFSRECKINNDDDDININTVWSFLSHHALHHNHVVHYFQQIFAGTFLHSLTPTSYFQLSDWYTETFCHVCVILSNH